MLWRGVIYLNDYRPAQVHVIGDGSEAVSPKSGVNFVIFVQICPKIDICSQNLCSSRSKFANVASAFQRFQPVNSTQYLLGRLSNEGRVD